jgi:hypothetical protein
MERERTNRKSEGEIWREREREREMEIVRCRSATYTPFLSIQLGLVNGP